MRSLTRFANYWGLIIALALTAASGLSALRQPAYGDAQAYMIPNGQKMVSTSLYPFIEDEVHPPLYFMLEAVAFRLAGERIEVAHALIVILAIAAVLAIYGLGSSLAGPIVGSAAALLLASWPPFLIQTRLIRLSIPLTAFSLLTLLAAKRNWTAAFLLFGSAAALTKAPGVLVSGSVAFLAIVGLIKTRIPKVALVAPTVLFLVWLAACKVHYGWFLHPENTADFHFTFLGMIDRWSYWARRLLVEQRAWIPMSVAVLLVSRHKWFLLVPPVLLSVVFWLVHGLLLLNGLGVGLLVSLMLVAWSRGGTWRVLAVVSLLITILFAPYHYRFPRYLLPAWPAAALFIAHAVCTRKLTQLLVPVFAVFFVLSASERTWKGWQHHECNLGDLDFISIRKETAQYLQQHAGEKVIIARKPADDLLNPTFGYTDRPLNVLRVEELADKGCKGIAEADFYYQLPTQSGRSEREMARRFRKCGFRLKTEWRKVYRRKGHHSEKTIVFSIHPRNLPPSQN